MKTTQRLLIVFMIVLPGIVFSQHKPTSYDSDGDGVPDSIDKCVLVPGAVQFQGCPSAVLITANDRDGDGIPDAYDACPDMFGVKAYHGCPDMALINKATGINTTDQLGNVSNEASLFSNTSSSEAQQLKDFKNNLLAVLASSGHMFSDIKTYKDEHENDYKTLLCLTGADECYVDLSEHFYANYGNYTDLPVAMDRYNDLKQTLQIALGETEWSSKETTENGVKSFEMRSSKTGVSFSPQISLFVQQADNNLYRVYLLVDSR